MLLKIQFNEEVKKGKQRMKERNYNDFLEEAYNSISAYVQMKKEEDEIYPILDRTWLLQNSQSVLSPQGHALFYQNKLMHGRTSGSTGTYMDIYWKPEDYKKSMLGLWWYRYHYYGILPKDKLCYFFTIQKDNDKMGEQIQGENREEIKKETELGFSKSNLTKERIHEIYEKMREFQPKWLLLQPSIALLLCECMDYYNLKSLDSVSYIELSGEMLTDKVRNEIRRHFHCAIANQYGANEFNSIAYECPYGKLHIMRDNVIVESERLTGQEEELIITTKTNTMMPLIRYRIGDYGKVKHQKNKCCPCKNTSPILELTLGRSNDYIICENGEKINAYVFIRAMDYVNNYTDGIVKQFQIVQKDYQRFEVKVVLEEECDTQMLTELFGEAVMENRLKEAQYHFRFYDRLLPEERTGKLACFISEKA